VSSRIGTSTSLVKVIDPRSMSWYDVSTPSTAPFQYGGVGWKPVLGDWNGDGTAGPGVIDPNGVWYLRNSNTAGPPDVAPFAYGLGGWVPLVGHWLPGSAGSPGAAARTLPQPLDGSLASLVASMALPAPAIAAPPSSSGSPPSATGVTVPAGGQGVLAGTSELPSRSVGVRQALLAGQARTAALDALFAAGLG
jgi:hypothetical protein